MSLKLAMIGTGKIAENALAPALDEADGGVLWSVLSREKARAREFAQKFAAQSSSPAYDDLDALLGDPELDGLIIASPDALHASQAILAAKAGKHVLSEKPLATDLREGAAMVAACGAAGVQLGVAYHMRWHTGHRKLAAAVHRGAFGEMRHMRLQWSWQTEDDSNWRASGDVGRWWSLAGVGTHMLDQVRWFMKPSEGEIVHLSSTISREKFGGPHDETAIVGVRFESGATAEICSSVLFNGPKRMEVYGTENYAICEETLGLSGTGRIWTREGAVDFEPRNPYRGEIEDFIDAVNCDRPPEVDGAEGLRNVELLLQAVS